ncbi:MAG: hypothetical protein AAF127_15895 [Pseudomonadota bacterium]
MTWSGDLLAASQFDFLIGKWRIRHSTLKERLAGCSQWAVANAIDIVRPAFAGLGNVGHFVRMFDQKPYCGSPIRLYDPNEGLWRIWWVDTVDNRMEPPVIGRFDGAEGVFEGEDTFRGQPIRVRFRWSDITASSAEWRQFFSADGGASWEHNSTMEFTRDDTLPEHPLPNEVERIYAS